MEGKWWSDDDLEKQDFFFAFTDVIQGHFWFRWKSEDTSDDVGIDLNSMKVTDKTEIKQDKDEIKTQIQSLAVEGLALWKKNRTQEQEERGGEHVEKIHHDEGYRNWYNKKLEQAFKQADPSNQNPSLNEPEFKAFLQSYRRLEEDDCGCYNPLPRQADKAWSLISKFSIDGGVQRQAKDPTFEHWKKFGEIYWGHFMHQFHSP